MISFCTSAPICYLRACCSALPCRARPSPTVAIAPRLDSNISIGPDEEVGDATCFGCSIRVRGHVSGDVTAFGGSIVVEDQGQVGGDVTAFGGDIRIDKEAKLGGDVTVFGGRIRRDPAATVGGDVTDDGGPGLDLSDVSRPA